MNKIKLMYDIAKAMQEKELLNGTLQAECTKDDTVIFRMDNAFTHEASGLTKANIKMAMNDEGKQFKHESTTEFTHPQGFHRHGCHSRHHARHFHQFHQVHHPSMCEQGPGGFKGFFFGMTTAFDILNRTTAEEQSDGTVLLTLEMNELPNVLKTKLAQRFGEGPDQAQDECTT